jgi:hypothetical protein
VTGEEFLRKWAAIDEQVLDMVEEQGKRINLLFRYIKAQIDDGITSPAPCQADSITSSPDSGPRLVSDRTYSQLPEGAEISEC